MLHVFVNGAALLLLGAAAIADWRTRLIPNRVSGTLFLLGLFSFFCSGRGAVGVATFLMTLIVLLLCWRLGLLGGGDVKLLAGVSLLLSPESFVRVAFWIAISGALLAIFYQLLPILGRDVVRIAKCRKIHRNHAETSSRSLHDEGTLPYAVAIVVGYVVNHLV
ncbi:prepilin peptidase [Acetobacter sacchari]|uniref:Prepilin peptidase n=1 Tax=Acetobacter sacchari TaxID=2661687 RepID=A0ABS3LY58_9PROT|nr:prepilin peptidase [Acetobacter sacchari]